MAFKWLQQRLWLIKAPLDDLTKRCLIYVAISDDEQGFSIAGNCVEDGRK